MNRFSAQPDQPTQSPLACSQPGWLRWGAIALMHVSAGLMLSCTVGLTPAIADEVPAFPPNPLEMTEPDPLLPQLAVDRPLSPQERRELTTATNEIQRQAERKFQGGDIVGAIELWNRELRLRRFLGIQEEVPALGRVGEVAWQESQTTEVRLITERLQQIELEVQAQTPTNYDLLLTIAQSYEKMRSFDSAIALYNQILAQARQRQDYALEETTLASLAQLNLAWFNYGEAAAAYLQLIELTPDPDKRLEYMNQLAYAYQQDNQLEQAIAVQQQLVRIYDSAQDYMQIPPLKLIIGDNYQALNRPDRAAPSYQEAYAVSRSTQQYGYAGDALNRLAMLYRSIDRPNDALVVYQLVIDVAQQSYDNMGIMEAYDHIGQVHREMGNNGQAIASFRRGLQIAQQLNYKVGYFNTQIQQLSQQ
jgi:tetratricopeptide (TPR) repeat protein